MNDLSQHLYDALIKRYKALNSDGTAPAHAQPITFVSKHDLLKNFIQLPRNTDDCAIAYFTIYFEF